MNKNKFIHLHFANGKSEALYVAYINLYSTEQEQDWDELGHRLKSSYWHFIYFILFFNFTILYWFCHISKWIRHRYTCAPHPEPSSLLPPHTIPLGRPSAPAPSIQYSASNLDWRLVSYMILYMFQCHSPKSSHPLPLPQSPKDCSIHQCLFFCLVYRVIVTIAIDTLKNIFIFVRFMTIVMNWQCHDMSCITMLYKLSVMTVDIT